MSEERSGYDAARVLLERDVPFDAVFAAFEAGDAAAMLKHVYPDGRVTAVGKRPDGQTAVRQSSFTEFAKRVTPEQRFRERISSPAIEIDGDVAMVWAPFTVHVAGKLESCGYDLFDLVRSPSWFEGRHRPYHGASTNGVVKNVDQIVDATIKREQGFFDALRTKIASGELVFHYVVGNHDRLLLTAPAAQKRIAEALGRGLDTGLVCSIGDVVNAHAGIVAQGGATPVIGVVQDLRR